MNKELEILTLGNYLLHEDTPLGDTFTRTFPATEECPALTVGLGLIRPSRGVTVVERVPARGTSVVMLNTFINDVAEKYLQYSGQSYDYWQELVLLDLGHVKCLTTQDRNLLNGYNGKLTGFNLFSLIPEQERQSLLMKHGFHKIATLVAYGYTENIDLVLENLDLLNKELPDPANYGVLITLLSAGVPLEDLHLAVQLPPEMVAEIYSN